MLGVSWFLFCARVFVFIGCVCVLDCGVLFLLVGDWFVCPCFRCLFELESGGKPSTWFPPGGNVEQLNYHHKM